VELEDGAHGCLKTIGRREFMVAYNTTWAIIDEFDGGLRIIEYYSSKMREYITSGILP
jgi:hypothetical protein